MTACEAAPRVALFADTFHEVNGAARTCREWDAFARRRGLPFLCVRWGRAREFSEAACELARSRFAFLIDPDLRFDPCFFRALEPIQRELERFEPEVIHATSPGDLGIAGAILAARLKTRFTLSWHTNLHEFAARRAQQFLGWMPRGWRGRTGAAVERFVLGRVCWFFGRGDVLFAPNPELRSLLQERTGRPVFPMGRGIDTELFHPARRKRRDDAVVIGFVGRLMPEKNLRLLPRVAEALRAGGVTNFRFQITGAGSEREWLERHLPNAEFTGVLFGEALAEAYAGMDIFAFPSPTDTFGNVVQEALASGAPAVVTASGGPRFIVRPGVSGFVAASEEEFSERIVQLAREERLRREMGEAARRQVEGQTWDRVFEEVYDAYARCFTGA
ncbi:MAG TPA: glycosyltransferase [Bryobacteraceae bacterium]|nr:glycosyltransferase [Bryobacteraceae bacterium]